ncbi:MAG: efflux transporter periplasmic adaptor subunit, partial [Sediminibacterium sp.]|nr:efflux transporter periplasmic adaptor subunit [Sediminibacterium sp.]
MKYLVFFTLTLCITMAVSCTQEEKAAAEKPPVCISDSMRSRITLDTAVLSNISNELQLSGEVGFDENRVVKVFPFSSGQVQEVKVSLGDRVMAGQVLAVIKSADIAGSYSDLRITGADIAIAKRQLDNTKALYEKGISSQKEYEEASGNYQKAVSTNQKIKDALRINGGGNTNAAGTYSVKA